MTKTFDQSKDSIAKLRAHFKSNQESCRAPGNKEAHVRQSLIDPFFEALGWDVGNKEMRSRLIPVSLHRCF
jgi:predicted type IV restriction endonuclease